MTSERVSSTVANEGGRAKRRREKSSHQGTRLIRIDRGNFLRSSREGLTTKNDLHWIGMKKPRKKAPRALDLGEGSTSVLPEVKRRSGIVGALLQRSEGK